MITSIYKKIEEIATSDLVSIYENIKDKILWQSNDKGRQSSLQYILDEPIFLSGCGKTNGTDNSHNVLADIYKNTLLDYYIEKFKLVRTRWMWMAPFTCYSIHKDIFPRIHIPIITNKECYFLFPENQVSPIFHLSTNTVWWVNTRLSHTFVNCSDKWRLHLVGSALQ